MPTIEQDLQQIRKAVYGREVREAIADGIEHCYDDVTNGVTLAEAAVTDVNDAIAAAETQTAAAIANVNTAITRANTAAEQSEEINEELGYNANSLVLVQANQPTEIFNKLWVKPESDEYEVPTYAEHQAVAADVSSLKSAVLKIDGFSLTNISNGTTWEQGSINTAGANSTSDDAIRYPNSVDDAIDISACATIQMSISNGYQITLYWYDSSRAYLSRKRYITGDVDYLPVSGSKYVRFVLSKTESGNVAPSDASNVAIALTGVAGMIDPDYFIGTDNQRLTTAMAVAKDTNSVIAIKRKYTLSADLLIDNGAANNKKVVLMGLGKGSGIACSTYKICAYDANASYGMVSFMNLCFSGGTTMFKTDNLIRVNFINCTFSGGNEVIYNSRYMQTWLFSHCVFRDSKNAVVYSDGPQGNVTPQMIDVHFSQCTVEASVDFIRAYSIQGVTVDQCCIEGLSGYVCKCDYEACNLSVTNCYLETNNCRISNPDFDPGQPEGESNPRYIGTGNNGCNFDFSEITRNNIEITISNNRFKGTIYAPDTASNIICLPNLIPNSGYITISGNNVNVDENVYLVKAHPEATEVYAHVILIGNRGDTYDGGSNNLLKWYQVS